jgi:predicted Ser/Thr protein kinase
MHKIQNGTASQQEEVVSRMTEMIQKRWPDDTVTGYLGPERVSSMAQIFAGRADTLQGIIEDLDYLFEMPDWSSEEAKEMLALVGPAEYGKSSFRMHIESAVDSNFAERVVWKAHDFISEMHGRDIERLPRLEAALKDLAAIVIRDQKVKEGSKRGKGNFALLKPLRLALTAKKVRSFDTVLMNIN